MFWLWFWDSYFGGPVDWAVETANPGDAAEFSDIHGKSFARGWGVEEMEDMLRDRAVIACALRRGGRSGASGFALSRVAGDEAEVLSVAVSEARRGAGGGSALMASHLGRLTQAGVRKVALEVDEDNAAAIALYARFGFVEVGKRKAYYARKDGSRASAKVMTLELA